MVNRGKLMVKSWSMMLSDAQWWLEMVIKQFQVGITMKRVCRPHMGYNCRESNMVQPSDGHQQMMGCGSAPSLRIEFHPTNIRSHPQANGHLRVQVCTWAVSWSLLVGRVVGVALSINNDGRYPQNCWWIIHPIIVTHPIILTCCSIIKLTRFINMNLTTWLLDDR